MRYASVVVGGTFDTIHVGHEALLTKAFEIGEKVTIGLTTDEYIKKFKDVKTFTERKSALVKWLNDQGWTPRASIVPLEDQYGPTVPKKLRAQSSGLRTVEEFDAIVVSSQTEPVAQMINSLRLAYGYEPLAIIEVPMVLAEDGRPVTSTRLKNRDIDGDGRLVMPDTLRAQLKKPLGKLYSAEEITELLNKLRGETVITVGDMTTATFLKTGITPSLSIVDLRVDRKPFQAIKQLLDIMMIRIVKVKSGPGFITREAVDAIRLWVNNPDPAAIIVEGEEDLLALPAIQYAPLESFVLYGQPNEGVVCTGVTESQKLRIRKLLSKFVP